ncbi:MAG TPA: PEGA domain-containing protein [Polyangia bacterium]|nr:PEGA domain-containing protein [Polyangia bacterium]
MTRLALLVAVVLVAQPAFAGNEDEEKNEAASATNVEAKKRFAEGNERYSHGDYDGAVESFKAAIAADPKLPGPYRNLGLAYRALNRCNDAMPMYEKYLELKPESRFTDRVRREIDLCRAKLGQAPLPPRPESHASGGGTQHAVEAQGILHVSANLIGGEATDEATVKIDGLVRGATPLTIPVTPGVHKVHLSRGGFETANATVEVAPGERRDVELTMNKLPDEHPPIAAVTDTGPKDTGPKVSYAKYGWILLGIAAGAGAIGAGFGIAESQLHGQAVAADPAETTRADVNSKRDTGSTYSALAYTGIGIGGAALLAAAIVFIVDPSRGETHDKQQYLTIAPSAGPTGGGLVATVRF